MADRIPTLRSSSKCSWSVAPWRRRSSEISGYSSLLPVRITFGTPVGEFSAGGYRSWISSAHLVLDGSTWANATCCGMPWSSTT